MIIDQENLCKHISGKSRLFPLRSFKLLRQQQQHFGSNSQTAEMTGQKGIHRPQRLFVAWITIIMHFSTTSLVNDCLQQLKGSYFPGNYCDSICFSLKTDYAVSLSNILLASKFPSLMSYYINNIIYNIYIINVLFCLLSL